MRIAFRAVEERREPVFDRLDVGGRGGERPVELGTCSGRCGEPAFPAGRTRPVQADPVQYRS